MQSEKEVKIPFVERIDLELVDRNTILLQLRFDLFHDSYAYPVDISLLLMKLQYQTVHPLQIHRNFVFPRSKDSVCGTDRFRTC